LIPWFWSGTEREKQARDREHKQAPRFDAVPPFTPGEQPV